MAALKCLDELRQDVVPSQAGTGLLAGEHLSMTRQVESWHTESQKCVVSAHMPSPGCLGWGHTQECMQLFTYVWSCVYRDKVMCRMGHMDTESRGYHLGGGQPVTPLNPDCGLVAAGL